MAFLVSKAGEFSTIKLPEYLPLKASRIKNSDSTPEIDSDTPLKTGSSASTLQQRKLKAYQQNQDQFELEHKIYHARDIMSKPVHTLDQSKTLEDVTKVMERFQIHHVPIFDGNTLVGLITSRDLIKSGKSISEIMQREVITATDSTRIQDIAKLMLSYKIHCLPIINDDKKLVGMITEKDLLRLIAERFHDTFWA